MEKDKKYKYIPYDNWPEVFIEWLDRVTSKNKYPNVIEHHRGFVSLVTVKMPVSNRKAIGGIRYGRIQTDSLGSYLEIKYRPVIIRRNDTNIIVTLD